MTPARLHALAQETVDKWMSTSSDITPLIEAALQQVAAEQRALDAQQLNALLCSRDFYELMQDYRHTPITKPQATNDAFDAVKAALRGLAALRDPQERT